jgi:8-oxo-dGTP pyrophosphatase MutT (NUDIX family)
VGGVVKKEATASVFVVHRGEGWRVALVLHPRFAERMPAGGHVEVEESPSEAALREVWEETGLRVRLVSAPRQPLPAGFPHAAPPLPWWVVEMPASPDGHTATPHAHLDHVFLAVAESDQPEGAAAHRVGWFTADMLASEAGIAEDSRAQAKELVSYLPEIIPADL